MKSKYLSAIFCLLFLGSCSAFKNDCCNLINEPQLAETLTIEDTKTMPVAEPPTLTIDKPLVLADILGISLKYQLKSRKAFAAAKSACYAFKSSLSTYYPTITGEISYLIDDLHIYPPGTTPSTPTVINPVPTAIETTNGTFKSWTELVTLNYLLLDFGGRAATANAAWHFFQESRLLYDQSVQDVLIDSLHAYFNYMNAYESWLAQKENFKNTEHSFRITQELFDAKYAPLLDLQQLRTSLLQSETSLRSFQGNVIVTHGALAHAMGLKTSTAFDARPISMDDFPENLSDTIDELMHAALILKPDLSAAKEDYLQKESQIRVAQSAALPTFTTVMSAAHTHFNNGPTSTINESTIAFNMNVPIFSGFFFINQIRKSKADRDVSFFEWHLREQAAMLDVWSNYYNYLTARDNLEITKQLVESATIAYESAQELYRYQHASIQDLLTTLNDISRARLILVETKINMAIAISSLAYSIGVLIPRINEPLTAGLAHQGSQVVPTWKCDTSSDAGGE